MTKKTKTYFFAGLIVLFLFGWEKTIEKLSYGQKRIRYKFGFPFGKKRTLILIDVNPYDEKEKTVFFFDYLRELAYQYNISQYGNSWNIMGLYDVK